MRTIALIPARAGSKGVLNKNLKEVGGRSLLAWSIHACRQLPEIDRIFLSTDSADYAEIGKAEGAEVPFLRPSELAGDKTEDIEVFSHFADWMYENSLNYECLLHIRPTTPLRDPEVMRAAINAFEANSKSISSLRSVQEMSESAYKAFEISQEGYLEPIFGNRTLDGLNAPRQAFPKTYTANGYIDIVKTEMIKKSQKLHGSKILSFETPQTIEIDNLDDLLYATWKVSQDSSLRERVFK